MMDSLNCGVCFGRFKPYKSCNICKKENKRFCRNCIDPQRLLCMRGMLLSPQRQINACIAVKSGVANLVAEALEMKLADRCKE